MPKTYQEQKLEEISSYTNSLYAGFSDATKTINTYIVGLSSSAIFAFFVLMYKFGADFSAETITVIKFASLSFLISLLFIGISLILESKILSHHEHLSGTLRNDIPSLADNEIKKRVDDLADKINSNVGYKITTKLNDISYASFILAIGTIGYLLLNY